MATGGELLQCEEDQNWIKACLATRITRDGIQGILQTGCEQVQRHILDDIATTNHVQDNITCEDCPVAALGVLPCPTKGLCKKNRGKCQFHNVPVRPCPKQLCDTFREKVKAQHRFDKPSWKNTNSTRWCSSPFEVAKCFYPPDGYLNVESFESTDFNGLISILINCKWFDTCLSADISQEQNICTRARDVTRDLRHNAKFKLTTGQLSDVYNALLALLGSLPSDIQAKQAFEKVTKLKAGILTLTTVDINSVIEEISLCKEAVIKDISETTAGTLADDLKKARLELEQTADGMKTHLNQLLIDCQTSAQGIVEESLISLRDEGTATAGAILSDTAREMEEQKKAHLRGTQIIVEQSLKRLRDYDTEKTRKKQKQANFREITSGERRNNDDIYKQTKERFKEELIQFYRKKKRYMQVSPLNPKRKQKLADVFVSPRLCREKKHQEGAPHASNQNSQPLRSYREMFFNGEHAIQKMCQWTNQTVSRVSRYLIALHVKSPQRV